MPTKTPRNRITRYYDGTNDPPPPLAEAPEWGKHCEPTGEWWPFWLGVSCGLFYNVAIRAIVWMVG